MHIHGLAGLYIGLLAMTAAAGETVVLSDSHRGVVGDGGGGLADRWTYFAGQGSNPAIERRNFLTFDLPTGKQIESATLRLFMDFGGFFSLDGAETYQLYDVDTPLLTLLNPNFMGDQTFIDLGTGTTYGNVVVSDADEDAFVNIVLNSAAIADMNASLGETFALGGRIITLDDDPETLEFAFAPSPTVRPPVELVLNLVPAPGALAVFIGAAIFPCRSRRRLG